MPRPNPVLAMSNAEFHVMEHRLGWRHEYINGSAHLTVQESAVVDWRRSLLKLTLSTPIGNNITIRLVRSQDQENLVKLFLESFEDSIEYSGCSEDYFRRDAQDSIRSFFGLSTVNPIRKDDIGLSEASFLIEFDGAVVAAILVRPIRIGLIVEPIMVKPSCRRRGLSNALLNASLNALSASGATSIYSQSHLGNPVSCAWHASQGFAELPSVYSASHRADHFDWLAKHHEHNGRQQLALETRDMAKHWRRKLDTLQAQGIYVPLA